MTAVLGVIPVRMAATRLPGKPLADLAGTPMVLRVLEGARAAERLDHVIVATPDPEIHEVVTAAGGHVEMTSADHPSGTDRVAEVAARHPEFDVVANVQGDQPFVTADLLDRLLEPFDAGPRPEMCTVAAPLDPALADDPATVTVVHDVHHNALYFSRHHLPFSRDGKGGEGRHHLGLYAYRRDVLLRLATLAPTPLEEAEGLEQLRALEHAISIRVVDIDRMIDEVNTVDDLGRARRKLAGVR